MSRTPIRIRRCRRRDLAPALRLIVRTVHELRHRTGKDNPPVRLRGLPPGFVRLFAAEPESFYCAWAGRRLVGFTGAINRQGHWYLGWLFIDRRYQDRGIGRRLLDRVWRARARTHSLATFSYNMQAVGLYSRFGLYPHTAITMMRAKLDRLTLPPATGLTATNTLTPADWTWIHRLEDRIRGFRHPGAWRGWASEEGNQIWLLRRRGRRVGYGMLVRGIELSPVGAVSPAQLGPVLQEVLRRAIEAARARSEPPESLVLFYPHRRGDLYQKLLGWGFRNEEMLLFMTDRLEPDFRCYIPANLAVF